MLLGENPKPTGQRYSDNFDTAYIETVEYCGHLITRTMLQEAWMLMSTLKKESIPLLYNRALCLWEMNRNEDSLKACQRILALLGTMKNKIPPVAPYEMQALHEVQKSQVTYLNPVSFRYVDLFPEILRDSLLRFMIDLYLELGNTAKVIEIGTPLLAKGYRNVLEALEKIKTR